MMDEEYREIGDMGQSLLNWYEFKKDASLLELGGGHGTLTELFFRRCRKVTVMGDSEDEALALKGERFDYIVGIGQIEYQEHPAEWVQKWMGYLKPDGILLLSAENRYGLKYFCGAKDPHTGLPFDGINGYFRGSKGRAATWDGRGRCVSRQELSQILKDSGAKAYKFYYPIPDSRMPQMIFTDQYMNGLNAAERLADYNYEDRHMVGLEHRIFREMIDGKALPFLSDSFLVEVTNGGSLSDIIYAVPTTDRGKAFGTATTIREGGFVKKRPLWPEGEENIRRLHSYTEDLWAHKIPVVQTRLEEDPNGAVLTMPFIEAEGLSSVLKKLAGGGSEKVLSIFDRIYGYIQSASKKIGEPDLLEKAYIDLAPCNCFYIKETGALLFYDQEFAMENCPARFAMFRTLKYAYDSIRDLEQVMPLKDMYRRYGISDGPLREFEEREEEFIRRVRNTGKYGPIFRWAAPDYDRIYKKMEQLRELGEREPKKPYRLGYVPGVFDLFHAGHLKLLERCKARCDRLIVGVLTDELVMYYKGHEPVITYEGRAEVIRGLKAVDEVIPVDFSNTDKLKAWEQLHYDCHFSGDDHKDHWNDVWEELKKRGSNMEFFPYTEGISTTKIRGMCGPNQKEVHPNRKE